MEKPLLLLPFVHGIDISALSCALAFAQERDATLLLVALIHLPKGSKKLEIRAEAVAQVYDFFEVMRHKAARAGVTIRCMHLSTQQRARSIQTLAQEMVCAGILLFVRERRGVLLETEDIKQLFEQGGPPLYLFRLAARKNRFARVSAWLRHFSSRSVAKTWDGRQQTGEI